MPIFGYIVLPYSKTRVAIPPKNTQVIFGRDIGNVLEELDEVQQIISREKFIEIIEKIDSSKTFFIPKPLMTRYPIKLEEIKNGLMCSHCYQSITFEKSCPNVETRQETAKKKQLKTGSN